MYKQVIIARKDLNMSAGKLAAQVSHASIAFLTTMIRRSIPALDFSDFNKTKHYFPQLKVDKDLYNNWINGEFTKVVLQAKNKDQIMKAVKLAQELGMKEGDDYFLIRDNCHTELTPEEDERTLTCIGFKPMNCEIIDKIGKKFHMYIG